MTSLIQKLKRFAPSVSDAFFFLFKVYLLFFFVFVVLETEEPGLVSGHLSFSAWALVTVGMGFVAFFAEYLEPSPERLPLFRRSNIVYTILLASCILIWILLSLR